MLIFCFINITPNKLLGCIYYCLLFIVVVIHLYDIYLQLFQKLLLIILETRTISDTLYK